MMSEMIPDDLSGFVTLGALAHHVKDKAMIKKMLMVEQRDRLIKFINLILTKQELEIRRAQGQTALTYRKMFLRSGTALTSTSIGKGGVKP